MPKLQFHPHSEAKNCDGEVLGKLLVNLYCKNVHQPNVVDLRRGKKIKANNRVTSGSSIFCQYI
jgi:hypothetical protein